MYFSMKVFCSYHHCSHECFQYVVIGRAVSAYGIKVLNCNQLRFHQFFFVMQYIFCH